MARDFRQFRGFFFIALFIILPTLGFIPRAHANVAAVTPCGLALPPNTLFYDDFCSGLRWHGIDTTCGWSLSINSTIVTSGPSQNSWQAPGSSHSLRIKCTASTGTGDAKTTMLIPDSVTRIGFAGILTHSNNLFGSAGADGASVEVFSNNRRYEGRFRYIFSSSPLTSGLFVRHDSVVDTVIEKQNAAPANYYPAWWGYDAPVDNTHGNPFMPFKIIIDRTTLSYVSITTPEHTWGCSDLATFFGTSGCNLNNEAADSRCGSASTPNTCVELEHQVDLGGVAPTNPAYYDDFLSNVIVTDETPNNPNIIQFGLVGYSAWIPLIMAMAGVNTTLSTWSLVIRLLKKNDGSTLRGLLVAHTKMIVAMNIAVVAFLIVLVIGSIYLPGTCPAGAVCKG